MLQGLANPSQRCWFNAAFQAWSACVRALRSDSSTKISLPRDKYCVALMTATDSSGPDRANIFFEVFADKFLEMESRESQHDPVAALCAIPAHTNHTAARVPFVGLTTRTISCTRCPAKTSSKYIDPIYSIDDPSILARPEQLVTHLLASESTVSSLEIPTCTCPPNTPQKIIESRRLPKIMILAVNTHEPSAHKANIPRVLVTPTNTHRLIAVICKSGPPAGGHCWAHVRGQNSWVRADDLSISSSTGPDEYVIAGIYYRGVS